MVWSETPRKIKEDKPEVKEGEEGEGGGIAIY